MIKNRHLQNLIILLGWVLCFAHMNFLNAQSQWKLREEKEGLKIFMRSVPGSPFKALRIETTLTGSLSRITGAIFDMNGSEKWVYASKYCHLIKEISPINLYYYAEVDMPWPISDRDFVAHIKATQNRESKIVSIRSYNLPGMIPDKKGDVRVTRSVGLWQLFPLSKYQTKIIYELEVDPAGSIPAWLVNLCATQGPIVSFRRFRKLLVDDNYRPPHVPIEDK